MTGKETKTTQYASWAILILLSVYVVVNPWSHTTSIKEICFYGAILGCAVLFGAGKRDFFQRSTPLWWPTILFIIWVGIGFFWSLDKENSWHDIYSHLLRYVVLAVLVSSFFDSREKMEMLVWLFASTIAIFLASALIDFYLIKNQGVFVRFFGNSQGMTYNLLSIPAIFSFLGILCIILTNSRKFIRLVMPLLFIPLVAGVILSQARSAFIALTISLLLFLSHFKIRWLVPAIALFVGIAVFFSPLQNRLKAVSLDNLRIIHALVVLEAAKDYPVMGIGFGKETFGKALDLTSYKKRVEQKYNMQYRHSEVLNDPHNMYTDILVRTGLPGLVLFFLFVLTTFRMLWQITRSEDLFLKVWGAGIGASLVAYFIIGFFEPVFNHMHEFNFAVLVGFVSILWRQHSITGTSNNTVLSNRECL